MKLAAYKGFIKEIFGGVGGVCVCVCGFSEKICLVLSWPLYLSIRVIL